MTTASEDPTEPHVSHDDEINLLDLMLVLARRWRMIAGITVMAAIVAAGIALILPNKYQATAKVLTLQRQVILPVSTAFQKTGPIVGAQKSMLQQAPMPVVLDVLLSDSVLDSLTNEFKFLSVRELMKVYKVKSTKSGTIEINVEDVDPKRAAAIANAAVVALGRSVYAANLVASPLITSARDSEKEGDDATTVIKLLQPATPPVTKSKPKRALIVILATVTAAFATVLLAFLLEGLKNLQSEDRARWDQIKAAFKG